MEASASSVPSIWSSFSSWFTPTVFFLLLNLMIATIFVTSNLPNNNHQENQHEEDEQKRNSQHEHHQNDRNQPKLAKSPSILHRLKSFSFYPHRSHQDFSSEIHHQQVAATDYVFNHHDHDVQTSSANDTHFDFDPTRSDQVAYAAATAQFAAFDQDHEVRLPNTDAHFVWEQQQTVETVTSHFNFDPTHHEIPKDTPFKDAHEEQTDEFKSLEEVYGSLKGGHVKRTKSDGVVPPKIPAKMMKKSASLKSAFSYFEEEDVVEARRPATVRESKSAAKTMEEDDDVEVDAKADDFINKFKNGLKLQRLESMVRSRGTAK